MTARRLVLRMTGTGRFCLASRIAIQSHGGLRFSSAGPATIADTGFWRSLIPKPFRKENRKENKGANSREWNPATFFIVMFLFIGSMSIQMIALRNQSERYNRQSMVRLQQLRDALRKLQSGEKVDVESILGNGEDPQQEADWEEILKAMERDEASQVTENNTEKPMQPEAQTDMGTEEIPETNEAEKDDGVSVERPTSNSKPASLGNFF